MTGADSQELGDWGEDQVRAALTGRGFTVHKVERDPGEDFLVELGGRRAALAGAPPPRQAYVQVKTHSATAELAADAFPEQIERKHLLRWGFQRIPVFLVSVLAGPDGAVFFLRCIDDYLGESPACLDPETVQASFRVYTRRTSDLATSLVEEVQRFHRTAAASLAALDDVEVANDHIEFVHERSDPHQWAKARLDFWKAFYKSPTRPANLHAVVQYVAERARGRVAGGTRPSQVHCFLYRSQVAMNCNQWVASITWSELDHPLSGALWPGRDAIEVRMNSGALETQRYIGSRMVDARTFAAHLRPLARRADALTGRVIQASDDRVWLDTDVEELKDVMARWDGGPIAPPALHHVDTFFDAFLETLDRHRWTVRDEIDVPEARRARWRAEKAEELVGFRGAVELLLGQAMGAHYYSRLR